MVSFPYYSHIFRDSYGNGMGIVWEAYHKQVPLLGVPGITLLLGNCSDSFRERTGGSSGLDMPPVTPNMSLEN